MISRQNLENHGFRQHPTESDSMVWEYNGKTGNTPVHVEIKVSLDGDNEWVFAKANFTNIHSEDIVTVSDVIRYIKRFES